MTSFMALDSRAQHFAFCACVSHVGDLSPAERCALPLIRAPHTDTQALLVYLWPHDGTVEA